MLTYYSQNYVSIIYGRRPNNVVILLAIDQPVTLIISQPIQEFQ